MANVEFHFTGSIEEFEALLKRIRGGDLSPVPGSHFISYAPIGSFVRFVEETFRVHLPWDRFNRELNDAVGGVHLMPFAMTRNRIGAIKLVRTFVGCGLREAKDCVDAFLRSKGYDY